MKTAPCDMRKGSATTDHKFAFFMTRNSSSVYRFEWNTEEWDELPPCPYRSSSLAIINGALTAVGGYGGFRYTNKLFTLRQWKWLDELPQMKTPRSETAVVACSTSDGEYIFVIGGLSYGDHHWTTTVELFQVRNRKWRELTNLPKPLAHPSATICGNCLNVIGDESNGYLCSLQDLSSSDQHTMPQSSNISWSPLPRLPVRDSTAATLCGQLILIGGIHGGPVNSIHQLVKRRWVKIGSMSSGRSDCLVVFPSPDRLMIVCGQRDRVPLKNVEECVVIH